MKKAPSTAEDRSLADIAERALKQTPLQIQSQGLESLPHKLPFLASGAAALYAARKRGIPGLFSAGVALGLLYHGARQNGLNKGGWKRRIMHTKPQKLVPFDRQVIIDRSPDEVYRFLRNLENLAVFLPGVRDVKIMDDQKSHWKLRLAENLHIQWTAKIIEERPGQLLVWKVCDTSDLYHEGWITFEPLRSGHSTRVTIKVYLMAPGGKLGARFVEWLKQLPIRYFTRDIQRLRNIIESEIYKEISPT